jgi:hypothetical protein
VPAGEEVWGAGIFFFVSSFFTAAVIEERSKESYSQTVAA